MTWRFIVKRLIGRAIIGLAVMTPLICYASTVTYTYDALGRLTVAAYPDGSCTAYQYDSAGNRTQYLSSATSAPIANNVAVSTYQDVASTFDPRSTSPTCVAATISAVGSAGHGTTTIRSGGTAIIYTPTTGYTGSDAFTYTVSNGTTATGNVAVTVNAPTLAPVAGTGLWAPIYYIIPPQKVQPIITEDVATIANSPYGYTLTVTAVTQGAHGAVTFSGGNITYTYPSMIGGNKEIGDSFNYTVSDGHGHTASSVVTVNISVNTNQ